MLAVLASKQMETTRRWLQVAYYLRFILSHPQSSRCPINQNLPVVAKADQQWNYNPTYNYEEEGHLFALRSRVLWRKVEFFAEDELCNTTSPSCEYQGTTTCSILLGEPCTREQPLATVTINYHAIVVVLTLI